MLKWPANSCCSSASTLPNTMSVCSCDAASKTGPNCLHGPHHSAQKSTNTVSLSLIVCSKLSMVSSTVDIWVLLGVSVVCGATTDRSVAFPAVDRPRLRWAWCWCCIRCRTPDATSSRAAGEAAETAAGHREPLARQRGVGEAGEVVGGLADHLGV